MPPSRYRDSTSYNYFIEFGARKTDHSYLASAIQTQPREIAIDSLVQRRQAIGIEDILSRANLEERIYRLRCVEAWSMVVLWISFPPNSPIRRNEPLWNANYVRFDKVYRLEGMRGQRKRCPIIPWPYVEELRFDEAMHQLTIRRLAFTAKGCYIRTRHQFVWVFPGNMNSRVSSRSLAIP